MRRGGAADTIRRPPSVRGAVRLRRRLAYHDCCRTECASSDAQLAHSHYMTGRAVNQQLFQVWSGSSNADIGTAWRVRLAPALRAMPGAPPSGGQDPVSSPPRRFSGTLPDERRPLHQEGASNSVTLSRQLGFLARNQDAQRPYFSNVIFVNASLPAALSFAK